MYDRLLNGSDAVTIERTSRFGTISSDLGDDFDADDCVDFDSTQACEAQVAAFIRRLMVDRPPIGRSEAGVDAESRIVFDVTVDGCRYVLTRSLPKPVSGPELLSPREQEISRMIAKGYPNKTIAGVLDISAWTVCTHLRRIFAKLGVSSRAAMVARLMDEYPSMFSNGNGVHVADLD